MFMIWLGLPIIWQWYCSFKFLIHPIFKTFHPKLVGTTDIIKAPTDHILIYLLDYGQLKHSLMVLLVRIRCFVKALWENYDVHGMGEKSC